MKQKKDVCCKKVIKEGVKNIIIFSLAIFFILFGAVIFFTLARSISLGIQSISVTGDWCLSNVTGVLFC